MKSIAWPAIADTLGPFEVVGVATGQPVLWGWVYSYLDQIVHIFLFTVAIMLVLLVAYFRQRYYGIVIPIIGVIISSIWGLGIVSLLGFNLDPLTLVIPFLISARAS